MKQYITIRHSETKTRVIKSSTARLHVEIAERIFYRFNSIYKDKVLEIDTILNNMIDKGFIIDGQLKSNF